MATPSSMGSKSSLSEAMALLPPLQLYRRLLRVHRKKLDPEMRILGDLYVKAEFRAHRDVENPVHIVRILPGGTCGLNCWGMKLIRPDRVLNGVAALCPKAGRGCLGWG